MKTLLKTRTDDSTTSRIAKILAVPFSVGLLSIVIYCAQEQKKDPGPKPGPVFLPSSKAGPPIIRLPKSGENDSKKEADSKRETRQKQEPEPKAAPEQR